MSADVDVARLTGLLWAPATKVGRSGLTLSSLVETAIALADDEGLEACSMRRLAERAGVGTMTLYAFVPGRDELVTLMLDTVALEAYANRPLPRDHATWTEALRYVADRRWEQSMAHPWICEVAPARGVLGPGETARFERDLEPLDGIGLSDLDMDALLGAVHNLVQATARWQLGLDASRATSGLDDEAWWAAAWPVLASRVNDTDYPVASRVGTSVASAGDPRRVLDFGVDALLQAVAARLDPSSELGGAETGPRRG